MVIALGIYRACQPRLPSRGDLSPASGGHPYAAAVRNDILCEINLGSPVTRFLITYAVDGRQYVAVSTGTSGTAAGIMGLTPEFRWSAGNNLFVFALPG